MANLKFWDRLRFAVYYVVTGRWDWQPEPVVITTSYRRLDHE